MDVASVSVFTAFSPAQSSSNSLRMEVPLQFELLCSVPHSMVVVMRSKNMLSLEAKLCLMVGPAPKAGHRCYVSPMIDCSYLISSHAKRNNPHFHEIKNDFSFKNEDW